MRYISYKKITYKLLSLLGVFFALCTNSFAQPKVINPERYKWITQTSPSLNDYLYDYFDTFQNKKLRFFLHVDFLSTDGYDEKDEEQQGEYSFATRDYDIKAKLIQGHMALGARELFFINSGIEVSTQDAENDGVLDFKEYALASYMKFDSFDLLGSIVYKTRPGYETLDGIEYFKDSSSEGATSGSINLMGSFLFLDTGIFVDAVSGLEKFYLELSQETPLGDISLRATNGRLPFTYDNISLAYCYKTENNLAFKLKSDYRSYDESTKKDGIVNTQLEIEKTFFKEFVLLRASFSSNREFSEKELYGYELYAQFGGFYFVGTSKNYSKDLARLPLEDENLFHIGLKLSLYD